ncbi:MAG TPA: hypothetical protein VGF09_02355 [Solirubrobacterales bacterium]|jgi:hypothetical protein
MGRVGGRAVVAVFAVALAAGVIGGAAYAEETPVGTATTEGPSRTEYVAELEEICKPGAKETQQAMDGVRDDVHYPSRIPLAAKKFSKAAAIFGGTINQISAVPRPFADEARLQKWFGYLKRQEQFLKEIASELRADRTIKAQRLTARFIHHGNLANNTTLGFGFNYCSFRFSRFG